MTFLRNTWYVAAWSREVISGTLLRRRLLGEQIVLFRDAQGAAKALLDRCPHRFAPLSLGRLCDGGDSVQCGYHGLRFDTDGQCVHNPHGDGRIPKAAVVRAYPVIERFSAIWIWMGEANKADPALIPQFPFLVPEDNYVACDKIEIDSHYELESDNILDLSHIEFMHPLFSSDHVSQGRFECIQDGDTIWSKRFIEDDTLPAFLHNAFGFAPGQKADRWLDCRWDAPACMALWTGAVTAGDVREKGQEVAGAHIFTPETEARTHYFFASTFPRSMGPHAEQMAIESLAAATGPKGVFTAEDKPMIEAQAENMDGEDFWSLKPILLNIDAAAVRVRRLMAQKIAAERSASV